MRRYAVRDERMTAIVQRAFPHHDVDVVTRRAPNGVRYQVWFGDRLIVKSITKIRLDAWLAGVYDGRRYR